ncbi:MAG: transcriptional regulator NrdR [Ruminococcus sp.]|jgi:transcriptional repressor NrdR|nr:transcriptional regulator NrdR [Ruminococcus sp.]
MHCPYCGHEESKVIDSRPSDEKKRRRRECANCKKRFTTYEVVEIPLLMVEKRDGTLEPFDRNKLIKGIFSAIKKRPVTMAQVDFIADSIENYCANEIKTLISSKQIGEFTLEHLKSIDPVAYIRFASVYKDFSDVESFIAAISELENNHDK